MDNNVNFGGIATFDNITSRVIDDLRTTLKRGSKVSMAAASFSIYAFEALQKELEQVEELRFIFTSPTFNKEREKKQKREFYIPKLNRERTLYGSDFEIKLRNNLTQKAIAKECADCLITGSVLLIIFYVENLDVRE